LAFIGGGWWAYSHNLIDISLPKFLKSVSNVQSSYKSSRSGSTEQTFSSRSSTHVKECYTLQLLYVYDRFAKRIEAYKKKVSRLGISSCKIQPGKVLESGDKQLFLRCGLEEHVKNLEPLVQKAKQHHLDYSIVPLPCPTRNTKNSSASFSSLQSSSSYKLSSVSSASSSSLAIMLSAKEENISQLQSIFAKRRSYGLALQIARRYMDVGKYREALRWAKEANHIDRKKEEAWILYAKALKALGQPKEAKQILRVFLQYQNSPTVQKLLKEWK